MEHTTCISKTFAALALLGALAAGCTHDEVRHETTNQTAAPSTSTEATATIAKEDTLLSAMPTALDRHPDVKVKVSKGKAFIIQLDGMMLAAVDSAVLHDGTYIATALHEGELPELPSDHVNVTAGSGAGYRLLPGGEHFSPYAELRVAYDEGKLPKGYTPDDIHTSYYDTETGVWTRLVRKEVDTLNKEIVSLTTHFTDFVNEVLKAPEMPETQAFVPTMMSELEAANPLEGLTLIQPPTANNNGTANLSYPLQIPAGRQGMQPNLALTYNSGGGNGWLGVGWDISIPSITVETRWGVPRYDSEKESEVYLLNGEQLVTKDDDGNYLEMPHRSNIWNKRRPEGTQFFPRVDDIHDSIVRHGDSPMNYWWSVTHSNGVTDYYGQKMEPGTNPYDESTSENTGTLRDHQGNIAKWMLTKSQDLYGNTVHYYYESVHDIGIAGGSIKGAELYLSEIRYTGNGADEGSYSIEFKRKQQKRQDAIITGNYGFKEVSADLLEGVVVKYDNKVSTIYYFETESPSYQSMYKTRLKSVTKIDTVLEVPDMEWETFLLYAGEISSCSRNDGSPFVQMKIPYAGTTSLFEYHDVPSIENMFGESEYMDLRESSSGINDNIFTRTLGRDCPRPSALGATKGKSWDIGGTAGVGIDPNVALSTFSVSGNYSYSVSENTGMMTLIDLNGDGLTDKVYKRGDNVYYRSQIPPSESDSSIQYGEEIYIDDIGDFLVENSSTDTWGAQVSCGGSLSGGWPKTTSMTSVYFADVNADGLPDLVNNGIVLFNSLNSQGHVTFSYIAPTPIRDGNGDEVSATVVTEISTDRCAPIIIDGEVDPLIACPRPDMMSVGNYTIADYLRCKDSLIELYPDGWWEYNPEEDKPYHFYVDPHWACFPQSIDPKFEAVKVWIAPRDGNVTIYDTIQMKENPSVQQSRFADGIDYSIQINRGALFDDSGFSDEGIPSELARQHIDKDDLTRRTPTYHNISVSAGDIFLFRLISGSDHAFDDVDWWHTIVYTNATNINDCYGRPANRFDSKGDFVVSGDMYFQASADGVVDIDVDMQNLNSSGSVNVVVKHYSQGVCSYLTLNSSYQLSSHQVHEGDSIIIELEPSGTVHWGNIICKPHIAYTFIPQDSLGTNFDQTTIDYYPPARMKISYPISNAYSLYGNDTLQRLFGPLYRGWGQFAYNNIFSNQLLSLSSLHLSDIYSDALTGTAADLQSDATAISENAETIDIPEDENETIPSQSTMNNVLASSGVPDVKGSNTRWIEMTPDSKNQAWYGYGQTTYITRSTASNTRQPQYVADIDVADIVTYDSPVPMPTTSDSGQPRLVQGIRKVSTSQSTSASLGLSLPVVTVGKSFSSGTNDVKTDYMDLNGDRYPDFIGTDRVQYSQPWGGIGRLASFPSWVKGETYSSVSTTGTTFGASCPSPQRSASGSPRSAKITVKGDGSAGASGNRSGDISTSVWMDMNGDGLPDRVRYDTDNRCYSVALNIGYTFLPYERWSALSAIRRGISESKSCNLGVNLGSAIDIAQGSISAGFALSKSRNTTQTALCDLNGDGLPDLWTEAGGGKVSYNMGNGNFSTPIAITALGKTNVSNSYNESVTVGVTYGVTISGIIKITVGANGTPQSGSITCDSLQVVDVNGDGFPDIVSSNSENSMNVRFNKIGKANLLKKVTNFTNSYFELSYEMPPACYEQPQRQWVLSGLTTHDNQTPVGMNSVKTEFTYYNPHYDRYERSNFGYETVVTDQYSGGNVYRSTREDYENLLYAKRGKKKHDIVYVGNDKYVEHYYNAMIQDGETTEGDTNCPTHITTLREVELTNYYEGHTAIQMSTAKSYEYDAYHNVVRYTNLGDINYTGDELHADITYLDGLPNNLVSLKSTVSVYGSDISHPYRRSEFQYDNGANDRGKLTNRKDFYDSQAREFDFEYDAIYGNMTKARLPKNNRNQRVEYQYDYDNFVYAYPVVVSNPAFGMQSTMEYDYRYGKPTKVVDVAGQQITYSYDYAGRTLEVKGPMSARNTLRYNYYPRNYIHSLESNPWADFRMFDAYAFTTSSSGPTMPDYSFATTTHYGDDGTDSIRTSTLVDASGLVIQTKSEADSNNNHILVVSGKVQYDEWGRCISQHDPIVQSASNPLFGQYYDNPSDPSNRLRTETTYDILDRTTQTKVHHDTSYQTETNQYDVVTLLGRKLFLTQTTDANGGISSSYTDGLGRNLMNVDAMNGTTSFDYDELGQLLSSTDPDGFVTEYEYDMLGQVVSRSHPDAGVSTFEYDPSGNLTKQTFANGDEIQYSYNYNRLTRKIHSRNAQNDVLYDYDAAGRVSFIRDGSGTQKIIYDQMGNVSENSRTFAIPGDSKTYTFTMQFLYDSWGRVLQMVYPDGEIVNYGYDRGWNLKDVTTEKNGVSTTLVNNINYNRYGKRTSVAYGNSTIIHYTYDDLQRLEHLNSTCLVGGVSVTMQDIHYDFDNVGNIISVANTASRISSLNMGGTYVNSYFYDANNRLVEALGDVSGYYNISTLGMAYSDASRIDMKRQPGTSQDLYFGYCQVQPHAPRRIYNDVSRTTTDLNWDVNGNLIQVMDINTDDPSDCFNFRSLYWSPENRMHTSINDEYYAYYVYDNAGERTLKLSGTSNILDQNAELRISYAILDKVTLYTSPYLVATEKGYTKHYYAGSDRICARIGNGGISDIVSIDDGDIRENSDKLFGECIQEVNQREWIPNLDNDCAYGITNDLDELRIKADFPAFSMEVQPKVDTDPFQDAMLAAEDNNGMPEDELYFYHSDHLGGANWITDYHGSPVQHLIYRPFGEPFVDEHTVYDERFKFTGKELDEETGFGYFGARYMDHELMTGWLSVDPMADKYPSMSPYNYCAWNPLKLVDPDGKEIHLTFYGKLAIKGFNDIIEKGLGGQFKAAYSKNSDGSYTFSLKATEGGGDKSKLDKYQKAFYEELTNIIEGTAIANIDIVYGATNVHIGNYRNNQVDIADVQQFDDIGEGVCTKQGKLIHEFVEQYYKACAGYSKGTDNGYYSCHHNAIVSENNVNGSIRGKESYARGVISQQYSRNGNTTTYSYNTGKPLFKANKNAIINVRKY